MKRRTLLAGAGLTLVSASAGCLSQLTGSDDDANGTDDANGGENENGNANGDENGDGHGNDDGNGNGNENDPQIEGEHYGIQTTGDVEDSPLEHEVTLVQPRIDSPEEPLTLEMTVTNTDSETIRYGEKRSALGHYERDGAFGLHPPNRDASFDEQTGLWFTTGPIARTTEFQIGELEPGASDTQYLELIYLGEEQNHLGEGLPERVPDSFSFDLSYGVGDAEGIPGEGDSFEWQFTLGRVE